MLGDMCAKMNTVYTALRILLVLMYIALLSELRHALTHLLHIFDVLYLEQSKLTTQSINIVVDAVLNMISTEARI